MRQTLQGPCVQFARVVVEHALKFPGHDFYRRWLVDGPTRRGGDPAKRLAEASLDPWASVIERSMKLAGLAVPAVLRRGSDLVFNHSASEPVGHVGVLLDRNWVVESVDPLYRPESTNLPGGLSITHSPRAPGRSRRAS